MTDHFLLGSVREIVKINLNLLSGSATAVQALVSDIANTKENKILLIFGTVTGQ